MKDYVSIGIPIYNAERYLADAIKSVLAQTYPYWELILLDDGSTDNSLQIAKDFAAKDNRIRIISDGDNKKLPYRLNQLIKLSKGDFIARMDADDIMHPIRLEAQIKYLNENSDVDLVSGSIVSIDSNNQVMGTRGVREVTKISNKSYSFQIIHPSVTARKDWYLRNHYSTDYPRAEDFELWCRSLSNDDLNIIILPDVLLFYREFGNIDVNKLVSSYKQGYQIREKYCINNSFMNYFKMEVKCLIVKVLFGLGLGQHLSTLRNNGFTSEEVKFSYQEIVDRIVQNI